MSTIRIVLQPAFRPYLILAIVILLMSAVDAGQGRFLTIATAFSALQTFATYGLVALGLGLTMLIGEFDLSVAGVFGLAGCVALLMGVSRPLGRNGVRTRHRPRLWSRSRFADHETRAWICTGHARRLVDRNGHGLRADRESSGFV